MNEAVETLYEGRFLRILKKGKWEYVARVRASGAVHILAVTPDEELLIVDQYRAPIGCHVLELPAGIVGDDAANVGESAEQAAARELVEETGYRPGRVETLYAAPSSPGLASEIVTVVHASDLERVGEGGGVGDEDITVLRVPLKDVPQWLADQVTGGRYVDHKIYSSLYFLRSRLPD